MSLDTIPAAEVVRVKPGKATRTIIVRCPYCSKLHSHGWPPGMADIGPRVAHCHPRQDSPAPSYWIPTPAGDAA
jgi:hypothetical protein